MDKICKAAKTAESGLAEMLATEQQNPTQQIRPDGTFAQHLADETTFTDILIAELAGVAGERITVIPTSSHAEARRFGADWLWEVTTKFGVYGGLVQAKRGYPPIGSSEYRTIAVDDEPNFKTGVGQLSTLRQASSELTISASYAVYTLQETYVPKCKSATGPHSIHFVTAEDLVEGNVEVNITSDHSVTLSELLCCAWRNQGATLGNVPALTRRSGSVEDLIQAAKRTNKVEKILRVDLT